MKVRPYVITGLTTLCFAGALSVIVINNDPYTSSWPVFILFGAALILGLWSLLSTILLIFKAAFHKSIIVGFIWAAAIGAGTLAWRHHKPGNGLLIGVFLATLLMSAFILLRKDKSTNAAGPQGLSEKN